MHEDIIVILFFIFWRLKWREIFLALLNLRKDAE